MKITLTQFKISFVGLIWLLAAGQSQASGQHTGAHEHNDAAVGKPGLASSVNRTVAVDTNDNMRFEPDKLQVRQGETIRFVITNSGKLRHEFVLGTRHALKEHYALMMKNPEMEHSEPNMLTLAGGQTGELIWQFSKAGKLEFACLQAGHYDAGMKGNIVISKKIQADTTSSPQQ